MNGAHSDRVRLYVAGRLDGDEREAFEAALFEDEALLAEVEAERALRGGFAGVPRPSAAAGSARRAHWDARRWLSLAAAFVLGLASAALWRFETAPSQIQPNPELVRLETLRGPGTAPHKFIVDADAAAILLEVPLASAAHGRFRLTVRQVEGRSGFVVDDLHLDRESVLSAIVPSEKMPSGNYAATVQRMESSAGETEARFEFRVERQSQH